MKSTTSNIDKDPRESYQIGMSRSQLHGTRTEGSAWRKRLIWIVTILLVLIAVSIGIWYWWNYPSRAAEDQSNESTKLPASDTSAEKETAQFEVPSKEKRATVTLVDPIESNENQDVYEVGNAEEVRLQLTAKKPAEMTIRAVDAQGKVLLQKQLKANEKVDIQHKEGIHLTFSSSAIQTLSVNGIHIEPSDENEKGVYQFRLTQDE
jgi:hypothetical protein